MHGAGARETESWTGIAAVLIAAFLGLFLLRFQPALRLLSETARPIAAAAAVMAACVGYGCIAIAAARRLFLLITHEPDDFEAVSLVDALLIGFAVLGTVTAIVAWTGIAIHVSITVVAAIGAAPGIVVLWRARPVLDWRAGAASTQLTLVAAIPVLLAFAQAISPVNSPDELIYKLAVPHVWLLDGRMHELPMNSNSYLCMADQAASLPALILAGGTAARLVHFAIFLGALGALYRLGSRVSRAAAVAVVALVSWTPAMMVTAGWAWNDWSTLGLLLIAFDRYERWTESTTPSDAAVAFAALGSAAAMKYTALPWLLGMAVIVVARHRRTLRPVMAGAAIAFLFGAFFYVRNTIWTGSPIAPLLLRDAPAVSNYRSGGASSGWRELVHGDDIFDPRIVDESLGILLPAAALLGIAALRVRERRLSDLVILSAIQLPIVLTIAPGSRNEVNAFVPIALAGTIAFATWTIRSGAVLRVAAGVAAILALGAQLSLVLFVLSSYETGPYLSGQESAAAYLQRTRAFVRPYGWIDRFTPRSARFILLGEIRTFYLQRSFVSAGNLDGPRVAAWLSHFSSPDALSAELRRMGVTHLLLHTPWYRVRGAAPGMLEKEYLLEVSAETDAMLRAFLRSQARVVYRDGEYLIAEVSDHARH